MKERNGTGVVYGALAFDPRVADPQRKRRLDATEADTLAEAVHRNLVADCPDGRALRLTLGAAYYDACELLRIGWPLHRRLRALSSDLVDTRLDARAHRLALVGDGGLPEPQGCAGAHALLTLPFMLEGAIEPATDTLRHLDRNRMLPYTPRARAPAFELPTLPAFDAVGYLSMRSLSTELAGRYYSDGLGGAWSLIERVLFAPKREHEWHEAPKQEHGWYEAPKREHEWHEAPKQEHEWYEAPKREHRWHEAPKQEHERERPPASLRYADGRVRLHDDGHERTQRWRDLLQAHGLPIETATLCDTRESVVASA